MRVLFLRVCDKLHNEEQDQDKSRLKIHVATSSFRVLELASKRESAHGDRSRPIESLDPDEDRGQHRQVGNKTEENHLQDYRKKGRQLPVGLKSLVIGKFKKGPPRHACVHERNGTNQLAAT